MNKQKVTIGVLIGLILVIIIGISMLVKNMNSPTGAVIYNVNEINVAINPIPNSALLFIAEEKGYFKEQGLKINYHHFPTGKLALDALIGGGADIATAADVPIALAGLAEQDISVLATIEYSNNNIQVVARKDSGIITPTDLKGKKIATTNGGGPLFFTYTFLERNKINISDVKLIYLNPGDMVAALIKGDIDAFIVFEPSPAVAKREMGNSKVTVFAPTDLYGETWNIVTMSHFDNQNEYTIKKFIIALLKAETFLKENKEESLEIVSKYSGTDKLLLVDIMQKQNYGVVLNNLIVEYPKQEAEWAIAIGISSQNKAPNYYDIIDAKYLRELKPSGVTYENAK
ncbi:NrtA/SsuA/CpmA family ABC transporter substrate-binding protein [Candidatus Woesearchaeota archaeon]|nr:NrtA/SsuA/CpmA family ABC transporter substrate-binding protein [Candidatus Woesearchaeota archaeon]